LASLGAAGATTYGTSFNGQTVSGLHYSGTVVINANNFTLQDCAVTPAGDTSDGVNGVEINGSNDTVQNCTIAPSKNKLFDGILPQGSATGTVINADDITGAENNISIYQTGSITIEWSYIHDPETADTGGHVDGIEVYSGNGVTIKDNYLFSTPSELVVTQVNMAPWSSGSYVLWLANVSITDNYLDGGNMHILYDASQTSHNPPISGVVIERNIVGGHNTQGFGPDWVLNDDTGNPVVQTDAQEVASPTSIEFPTSGPNANIYSANSDKPGQIATTS
jgi:hypothetical protein